MPFASCERDVAVFSQEFRHQSRPVERWRVHLEPCLAAHQHRAARHANRAAVPPKNIITSEAEAPARKAVQVRRFDVRIAVCGDGIGAHVVGKEEQDVGLSSAFNGLRLQRGRRRQQQGGEDRKGSVFHIHNPAYVQIFDRDRVKSSSRSHTSTKLLLRRSLNSKDLGCPQSRLSHVKRNGYTQ